MKHFSHSEFDSPDAPGSGKKMAIHTLNKADQARDIAEVPFYITSGFRTEGHNADVGGVPGSAHTRGYAFDIAISDYDEATVVRIISALVQAGLRRIGRANSFVHADDDPEKPTPAYWDYLDGEEHKA